MSHFSRRQTNAISMLVLLIGAGLSFSTAYLFHQRYLVDTKFEFERAAQNRTKALQRRIESSALIGKSTAAFFLASDVVTRKEFREYTKVILAENSYIQAVEWIPRVADRERELRESESRKIFPGFQIRERNAEGQLVRAARRVEYFPVCYIEPYLGNEKAIGYDLASDATRKEALIYARDHNLPSSTGRVSLIQHEQRQWGFLLYTPIYIQDSLLETVEQRRANLRGLVVIAFDIASLVESSLSYLHPGGVDFIVYDDAAGKERRRLYVHKSRARPASDSLQLSEITSSDANLSYEDTFKVNNRYWSVKHFPAPGYFETGIRFVDIGVFVVGVLFSLLVFAYLRLMQKREHGLLADRDLLERLVSKRTQDLKNKNSELEAYSYSIAHDLRSPLRSIAGFSQILLEDASDKLSEEEKGHLDRIVAASKNMAELIDDILELSRVMRAKLRKENVDLSKIAQGVAERLESHDKHERKVEWKIHEHVLGIGDPSLLMLLLDNLLGNAYKYSVRKKPAVIEFGAIPNNDHDCYFVRDNGIGFEMEYSGKIFDAFSRLHNSDEYEGTGIGLATVKRIAERHGGRVWAEGKVNEGAVFYFCLEGH